MKKIVLLICWAVAGFQGYAIGDEVAETLEERSGLKRISRSWQSKTSSMCLTKSELTLFPEDIRGAVIKALTDTSDEEEYDVRVLALNPEEEAVEAVVEEYHAVLPKSPMTQRLVSEAIQRVRREFIRQRKPVRPAGI
ncbi:MAG: hypothetical protein C0582_01845 [Alphaproteobacteria bacterium]|nr:MAG: hypothetical protein C0582_01845 [Alphaproteobacteria bacterium]